MSSKFLLSGLVLAVAGLSGAAYAQDKGYVKPVGTAGLGTLLVGQNGNHDNPYQLSTLGSAPAGTPSNNYVPGTNLWVELNSASSSFFDYVSFKVPTLSATTTIGTEFNLSVDSFLSLFTYFRVDLYQGLPTTSSAVLNSPLESLQFGGNGIALTTQSGSFERTLTLGTDYFLKVEGTVFSNNAAPTYELQLIATPVPEPSTYATLLAGLAAMGYMVKRRKNSV